jgi:hypothetical protein
MATALITVSAGYTVDETQKLITLYGTLVVGAGNYAAGGLTLDSVLLALPEGAKTNTGVLSCQIASRSGSGYVYQRLSNGKMMILQVPPNGSLTTAAPLQEIPTSTNLQGVQNDSIAFIASWKRNA